MASVTVTEHIRAPREQVFAKLIDYENFPDFISAITSVELLTEGEIGVGTRFRETRVMFGKEASEEMEIVELERPSRLVYTAASHGCRYRSTHELVEKNGGTELSLHFEGKGISFVGKLMSGLMGWMMSSACRKAIAKDFSDLKRALEAE